MDHRVGGRLPSVRRGDRQGGGIPSARIGDGRGARADDDSITAKLCPTPEADDTHAYAPTEAIAALAADAPCKWAPVPLDELAPMLGVGRQTLVLIGSTVHQLLQARWAIRPDLS